MLQTHLFTKTRRESPKDEVSINADLLIRGGFIHKEMAGVYSLLPLGLRVIEKINTIIREEMNAVGGQEVLLTALQDKEIWEKTGRWDDAVVDNWFKTELKNGSQVGLGFTHEEPLTRLMSEYISSYRDLPRLVYQIQTKFRNEARAKSGIMRGREFSMKDLYSFSATQEEHDRVYDSLKNAYIRVFSRVGLGDITYLTFASGGTFSKYSHEFQTLTSAGEDTIYVSKKQKIAVNKEVLIDEVLDELSLSRDDLVEERAVEVGNIFSLGTRFSEELDLMFQDESGEKKPVIMGSYGIGPGRLMGTIVETLSDEKGIVWPKGVAPFVAHVLYIQSSDSKTLERAKGIYSELQKRIEVLFDDRDARAGEKFADADLIGIPYQIIVSERGNSEDLVEVKDRRTGKAVVVPVKKILSGNLVSLFE